MSRLVKTFKNKQARSHRVRQHISGSKSRPRLSLHISSRHISAQIIDDTTRNTLVAVTTVGSKQAKGTMTERASWVGTEIAKKAKTAKLKSVVLDRGSKLYHGRVKALADAARQEGLDF